MSVAHADARLLFTAYRPASTPAILGMPPMARHQRRPEEASIDIAGLAGIDNQK